MDQNIYLASRFPHYRATGHITLNPIEFSSDPNCLRALRKDNYLQSFKVIYTSKKCLYFIGNKLSFYLFWYISNKMQHYTLYLFVENCSTCFGWYLHPSSAIAAGSSYGLTSTRCCKYSCVCSWWWMEITPETCRAVFHK